MYFVYMYIYCTTRGVCMLTCTCNMHMSYGLHCMLNTWKEKKTTNKVHDKTDDLGLNICHFNVS